jgi:hypothetical protein
VNGISVARTGNPGFGDQHLAEAETADRIAHTSLLAEAFAACANIVSVIETCCGNLTALSSQVFLRGTAPLTEDKNCCANGVGGNRDSNDFCGES